VRQVIAGVSCAFLLIGVGPTFAQSYVPFSSVRIDASFPLQYSTNSLLSSSGFRSDAYISPYFKLSALGEVNSTTSYSIYASGGPDIFSRIQTANDALATLGGKFQRQFGDFAVGAIYEHGLIYDGVFKTLLFQADDFTAYAGYKYSNDTGLTVKPSISAAYRLSDQASAQRFLATLKAELQQSLTKELSLFLTPKLRYYAFTDGISVGRRDTRPSILGGFTYSINDDVSVTTSAEYDRRWSNVTGKDFQNFVFLVSLDYGHTFGGGK
jgi:hypothetical protein